MGCGSSVPEVEKKSHSSKAEGSNEEGDSKHSEIDEPAPNVSKLLLLGAGESGKSTIFRQLVSLYGLGFADNDRKEFQDIIDANVIQSMQILAKFTDVLNDERSTKVSDVAIVSKQFIEGLPEDAKLTEEIANHVETLWADPGIKKAFEHCSLYQVPECADYFFAKVKTIAKPGYIPSFEDILRCRARTSGVQQVEFSVGNHTFRIVDVGGQRAERKKWRIAFKGVTAVLFVAALSGYDMILYEDGRSNRMQEALNLFSKIANSDWFKETPMILFLNKSDLFKDKIQVKDLTCCWDDYKGGCNYEKAVEFTKQKFKSQCNSRQSIFMHVTCATDTTNVQHVFDDVREIVLKESLKISGL